MTSFSLLINEKTGEMEKGTERQCQEFSDQVHKREVVKIVNDFSEY